ncbi:MAG: putative sulfate exporter family transporter [Anaerolineae bacterium]|nr:putative sulfate exporter family transporter [Anaerolineae bacterium]
MSQGTALAAPPSKPLINRLLELIPGILLLFVIGFAGKLTEQGIKDFGKAQNLTLPNIEYVLWAIIYGLIITNIIGIPKIFKPGVETYEYFLKVGIVLLGARFILGDVLKLGGMSLLLVVLELAVAIILMIVLGRLFKLSPKLASLLAIGSSICGVSAIIAGKGAIEADDNEAAFAIAAILALGAFGLFAYPAVGRAFNMSDQAFGVWAGLAVDNTAEASAAGAIYSDAAGKIAVLTKTTRNAMIGFVVLGFALYWASRGQAKEVKNKGAFLWQKFPKFILGFLFISLLATVGVFNSGQLASLGNLSRWAFLFTFAGVGLRTDFRELRKQGLRPFIVGALAELIVTIVTFGMVLGASAVFGL